MTKRDSSSREPVDPRREFSLTNPSRRVAIAAARVQVTANDRLGRETDPRVRRLAGMPLAG